MTHIILHDLNSKNLVDGEECVVGLGLVIVEEKNKKTTSLELNTL